MSVYIGIQARSTSTRLPGKALLDLRGEPVLVHVYRACSDVGTAVVLTPRRDPVTDYCYSHRIPVYEGSEHDVLDRYYLFGQTYKASHVVRITADCPLLSVAQLFYLVHLATTNRADYTTNLPTLDGFDVEVLSRKMLEHLNTFATAPDEREHVTSYIWKHLPELIKQFRMVFYADPTAAWKTKLSIDTQEDLVAINQVMEVMDARNQRINKALHGD